ncbi:Rap1a/Tai family immunity protein [Falsiroseomonas sp.]|uniref:Rap1a/Tai family immunity protein n=1 Tax=Falsiroseomonas sp. TaxID=2870721 RepID=UPI00356A70CB
MRCARRIVACTVAAPLVLGPGLALAQGGPAPGGIGVTTAELAQLCAAGGGTDAASAVAVGACRGFMVGVGQYHAELTTAAAGRPPVFCLPEPSPTFDAAQASFVAWSRANPQHAGEKAVIGLMRWAAATFPCAATPARAPSAAASGRR